MPHAGRTARPTTSVILIAACVAVALAACSAAPAGSLAAASDSQAASATERPSATEQSSADPSRSADATDAPSPATGLRECDSPAMPDVSSGWTGFRGGAGDFAFLHPDGWEDLSNQVDYQGPTLLSAETYAETGLSDDATVNADFVRAPEAFPNLAVFRYEGVSSDTATIYEREAARYEGLPDIGEILERDLETCLGGTVARGLSFSFVSEGDLYYQRNYFGVREDVLYVVQWLDELDSDPALLDDILSTWGWMLPPLEGSDTGDGADAGSILNPATAADIDENGDAPDPTTFTTSFGTDATEIYVVFEVADDAAGTVDFIWLREGTQLYTNSLDLSPGYDWAWGAITPPSSGFEPGAYEVRLVLGEQEHILPFAVEP